MPGPHCRPATCLIGCSGWQYKHWRGDFYPAALPQSRWLAHYAERFDTVEVNNHFFDTVTDALAALLVSAAAVALTETVAGFGTDPGAL